MRHILIPLILLGFCSAEAAIYGADQRRDISKTAKRWQKAADAVAVVLPTFWFLDLNQQSYFHEEHRNRHYGEQLGLCEDERFYNQKSFGHCSAFLVAPTLVVSAGHCVIPTGTLQDDPHSYCENFSFWFGYNDKHQDVSELGSLVEKRNVVECKRVIYAENNSQTEPEDNPIDFIIYELKEPVTHIEPLKLATRELQKGEPVATIGHPHGLPAKFSGLSPLLKNYKTTLSSYMDTLAGNSGGPAFNHKGEVVGILVSGHQFDTWEDKKRGCDRLNHCDNNGRNCDVGSDLENSNLLMKNNVWLPFIQDFLSDRSTKLF